MPAAARAITPLTGAIYLAWLFCAWTAYVFLIFPQVAALPHPATAVVSTIARFMVFAAPVIWLAARDGSAPWHRQLGLSGAKVEAILAGIVIAILYGAAGATIAVAVQHKGVGSHSIPLSYWFTTIFLSVIIEEIAFRGFLFRAFETLPKGVTVVASAAAFAAIHFPGWYKLSLSGLPVAWAELGISIFVLGCVLGVLYHSARSIWATSIVHSVNNLVAAMLR